MKSHFLYIPLIAFFLLSSCNNSKKTDSELNNSDIEIMANNSMNSLDWEGTYEGLLPCADCEGIKTVITVNKDNTYVIKEIYSGGEIVPVESKGNFIWDEKGQKISFSDVNRHSYFVGENTLTLLDNEGHKITGELAEKYILKKVKDQLVGKKWHLVSFKGEEIQLKEAKAEHPFVQFKEDFTIIGYTGCNNLQGAYKEGDAQKIEFSQLINTLRACPEMETENEFLKSLNTASYYGFLDRALEIYDKDHQKLATFKPAN